MPDQEPIERKSPVSEVNRIVERKAHAKRYYRRIYTMHKWWARRLGRVFRTIVPSRTEGNLPTVIPGATEHSHPHHCHSERNGA